MERPEQVEKNAKQEPENASARLLEDAFSRPSPSEIRLNKEAQRIVDLFDYGKNPNDDSYADKLTKGTEALSADLQQLAKSGNMKDYNKLVIAVTDTIPDEPAMNPMLRLTNHGKAVATPDKADAIYVYSGDSMPAFRIVQPGNTFNQIAQDAYKEFVKYAGDAGFKSYDEYKKDLIQLNGGDTNKLNVGQAIKLRDSFQWS